jgi:hypothetical protein
LIKKTLSLPILLTAFILGLAAIPSSAYGKKGVYDWAFVRLDYARREKMDALDRFCKRIHKLARQAAKDEAVVGCFDINLKYIEMMKKEPVPGELSATVQHLRENFNRYYIENYLSFYDILFVDLNGDVFYTIRKESDLGKNLIQGNPVESPLVECLASSPENEVFIDFYDYGPSSRPAAFFIEPVHKNGDHIGWILLQCAIQKVNTLLAWEEDLGQTGETFLINQNGFMLTESNFVGDSTILKKRLDNRNIQTKFAEKQGHRLVTDYRGKIALTSFKVVHFMDTRWLVVAKMDQDEIITRHYEKHRRYYNDRLLVYLKKNFPSFVRNTDNSMFGVGLKVDMDEFLKACKSEVLNTFGISTCTGLVVTFPGRFAYMAHASPMDKIYGAARTNLLGQVVKQVKSFDIRPCESGRIIFMVVSVHLNSLLTIIDKVVEEGFLLTQIRLNFNAEAKSAAMSYSYLDNNLSVIWRLEGHSSKKCVHTPDGILNVGNIIQEIIHSEDGGGGQLAGPQNCKISDEKSQSINFYSTFEIKNIN